MQDRFRRFGSVDVSLWLKASGHIGGDMVGCFPVNKDVIGAFSLDVSGHGVASAMIAARVAGILSAATPDQNIALTRREDGSLCALSPDMAAARLNKMILRELRSDRYFTMGLGLLNVGTGRMRMVQAGHPYPMVLRQSGQIDLIGQGGLPIGLVEEAAYSSFDIRFAPGDRLLIYSDGLTECPDRQGNALEEAGLARLVTGCAHLTGQRFLSGLEAALAEVAGGDNFPDDASAVLIDYHGPPT
jgi:sigma-B regulation protein RsbU (phosphoserine phosphatase)